MSGLYVLRGRRAVRALNTYAWGRELEIADRRVAQDDVNGLWVSTVFLGLDHSFGAGPPLLFETMIFDTWRTHPALGHEFHHDIGYQRRYASWEEAEIGHRRAVLYARIFGSPDRPLLPSWAAPLILLPARSGRASAFLIKRRLRLPRRSSG